MYNNKPNIIDINLANINSKKKIVWFSSKLKVLIRQI